MANTIVTVMNIIAFHKLFHVTSVTSTYKYHDWEYAVPQREGQRSGSL